MSIRVMSMVFEMNLPPSEKVVALALADHAHDDGTEARPGMSGLSVKASMSERQAQRIVQTLLEKKVITVQRKATNKLPTVYQFPCAFRGDKLSPQESRGDNEGDLGVTFGASRGDTHVTQTVNEPSVEPSSFLVSEADRQGSKYSADFEKLWSLYPRKHAKADAFKAFRARVKSGVSLDQLTEAVTNYAALRAGQDESYTMHGKTFFGPERWKDFLNNGPAAPRTKKQIDAQVDEAFKFMQPLFGLARNGKLQRPVVNKIVEAALDNNPIEKYGRMTVEELKAVLTSFAHDVRE